MWEARADYEDGTSICEYYDNDGREDGEQIYDLEEMLISRKEGCTWYSVNWITEEMVEYYLM